MRIIPNGYIGIFSKCGGEVAEESGSNSCNAHCWVGAMFHAGRRGFATGTISVAPRAIDVAEISFRRANRATRPSTRGRKTAPSLMSHCPLDRPPYARLCLRDSSLFLNGPIDLGRRKKESCRDRFPVEFALPRALHVSIYNKITTCTTIILRGNNLREKKEEKRRKKKNRGIFTSTDDHSSRLSRLF